MLKAVVVGSGWAGEGHTIALRSAGIDVVALCGRSIEPSHRLARRLEIPDVRTDWRGALSEFQPDIVSIATPAAPHREIAVAAAELGCHVFCDKPLAVTAGDARMMLAAVQHAGVKHAYGPASCLAPAISHARELLAGGIIGTLTNIESARHFGLAKPLAYSWFYEAGQGGGMLNNLFTHKLAQVLRLTDGRPTHVAGDAQCITTKAPVGPQIHDFRDLFRVATEVDEADPSRWRAVDADTAYSVILQLALPGNKGVAASFHASLTSKSRDDSDSLALYGTNGTLLLAGPNSPAELHHYSYERGSWEQLTVPGDLGSSPKEDEVQRDWNMLVGQFAADVRGEPHACYPTFEDGWLAAEVIELVRAGTGRVAVPNRPDQWGSRY